ncbi:MAG: T9SS type A sorting domain-containing protein, partial [Fidelibacterota bacterium]
PEEVKVTLVVYDILGQEVIRLVDTKAPAGFYKAIWNGRNKRGRLVSSGIYIYRIHAGDFTKTSKMIFMR